MTQTDPAEDSNPEGASWFDRFTIEPTEPGDIETGIETVDIPGYLGRPLDTTEPSVALYRLTQLFGTPNVETLTAGLPEQCERYKTTWQYVFHCEYDTEDGEDRPEEFILSIYDFKTDLSIGFSRAVESDGWSEPVTEPPAEFDLPDDEFLVALVQLALNMVEKPTRATYKGLWV